MNSKIIISYSLLTWFSASLAAAQDHSIPTIAPVSGAFKEFVRQGALISGSVVVGLQVRSTENEDVRLTGFIPEAWKGKDVCAQVLSIDGLYEGLGSYSLPTDWDGGLAEFSFPTEHADRLSAADEDELAIQLKQQSCGSPGNGESGIALWNAEPLDEVELLVNSFRADSVFLYVSEDAPPIRCEPVSSNSRTAYDTKCRIPSDGLSGRVDLEIYRVINSKSASPDTVTVWFP